jgi:hypothetical protein
LKNTWTAYWEALTSADVIGAILGSYTYPCGDDCASHWTRAIVLDKRLCIVELNLSKTQFHQFIVILLGNCYDEEDNTFQFKIGFRVYY